MHLIRLLIAGKGPSWPWNYGS